MTAKLYRLASIPAHIVVEHIANGRISICLNSLDKSVRKTPVLSIAISSSRLKTYCKGLACVHCGIEGHYFAVERFPHQTANYHLNLYHRTENGEEIRITSDHIVAKANGGSDTPKNRQTMCEPCNTLKADYESIDAAIRAKEEKAAEEGDLKKLIAKLGGLLNTIEYCESKIKEGDCTQPWLKVKGKAARRFDEMVMHIEMVNQLLRGT